MACFDIQCRNLPSGRGGRVLLWLVTPRPPPLVLYPFPENVDGWWGICRVDDRFWYYPSTPDPSVYPFKQ